MTDRSNPTPAPAGPTPPLNPALIQLTASVATALALVGMALLLVNLLGEKASTAMSTVKFFWLAAFAAAAANGVSMMFRKVAAQQFLLIFWLLMGVLAAMVGLASLLWGGEPAWWRSFLDAPVAMVAPILFVAAGGNVVLLVLASSGGTRLRYGTMVTVSIAAAIAVTGVLNFIVHRDPIQKNLEVLGRYGMSDRTRAVLDGLKTDVKVTVIYTSDEEGRQAETYRPRVLELLGQMDTYSDRVTVDSLNSDSEKKAFFGELRGGLSGKTAEHEKLLKRVAGEMPRLAKRMAESQTAWAALPDESYLSQWGHAPAIVKALTDGAAAADKLAKTISGELAKDKLPDFAKLLEAVKDDLSGPRTLLEQLSAELAKVHQLPKAVQANRAEAAKALQTAVAAAGKLPEVLGKADDETPPDKPAEVLKAFADQARKVSELTTAAVDKLEKVGGDDEIMVALVNSSRAFSVVAATAMGDVRLRLTTYLRDMTGRRFAELAGLAERYIEQANTQTQAKTVVQLRKEIAQSATDMAETAGRAEKALAELATVDDGTAKLLAEAADEKLFASITEPLGELLDEAEKLPEIKEGALSKNIEEDNVVILQVGEKTEAVPFSDVWPHKVDTGGFGADQKDRKRIFNGNGAIGSRVLAMTNQPFATVYLTFHQVQLPPQMAQQAPRPPIPPQQLGMLRKRLEGANFGVKEWNLVDEFPADDPNDPNDAGKADTPAPPKVLLVLPPATPPPFQRMPIPGFEAEHLDKLRKAIDDGAQAVFLTANLQQAGPFGMPMPGEYKINEYLESDWGLRALTSRVLVAGSRDEDRPGKFTLDIHRLIFMPINTFSDHPIGRPLEAQRVLWYRACPVEKLDELPEGVDVADLLSVPAWQKEIWSSSLNWDQLIQQLQEAEGQAYIEPDFAAGDKTGPFSIALAATRKAAGDKPAARVVLLGMGLSFADFFMGQQVWVPKSSMRGASVEFEDPPLINADLVVNSVYWCAGREHFIAAGPVTAKPVGNVPPGTMAVLWIICVVCLPLLTLGAGGLVLLARRR